MFEDTLPFSAQSLNYEVELSFIYQLRYSFRLLDTKYLCTNAELKVHVKSTVLGHVFEAVQKQPFELPDTVSGFDDHKYSLDEQRQHEAGYDAYLTGLCFLGLISYFKVDRNNLANDATLHAYFNRIFLLRLSGVNYIYTHGKEPTFSRDHVFFVTFPESWRQSDIVSKFRNYGQVYVSWVNNTSAFVTLHNRDYASHVIRTIDKSSAEFTICTLNQFKAKQQFAGAKRRYDSSGFEKGQQQQAPKNKMTEKEKQSMTVAQSSTTDDIDFGTASQAKKPKKGTFVDNDDW